MPLLKYPLNSLKLWKLEVNNLDDIPNYDVCDSFVICASFEDKAREIAADNCGDEGKKVWLDNTLSKIELIADTTCIKVAKLVVCSFNAG